MYCLLKSHIIGSTELKDEVVILQQVLAQLTPPLLAWGGCRQPCVSSHMEAPVSYFYLLESFTEVPVSAPKRQLATDPDFPRKSH